MKTSSVVWAAAIVLLLCTAASASYIYTNGNSDGGVWCYDCDTWDSSDPMNPHHDRYVEYGTEGEPTCMLLGLNRTYSYPASGVDETTTRARSAVTVFSLDNLKGSPLPVNVKLWFYASLSDDPTHTGEWAWYHGDADLGAEVVKEHFPSNGPSTQSALQNPIPDPAGWYSIDVTAQVRQDLARGFNNSAFMLCPTVDGATGIFGTSEGEYGAYLAIPEPASVLGLMCGLCGAIGFARRRR